VSGLDGILALGTDDVDNVNTGATVGFTARSTT
jgi:hypothetical protein